MRPFTRSQRLKYWFDNTMSAGTPALIAWLAVVTELFSPEGAELYLRPASDYVVIGRPMLFYTVVEAVHRRYETAVGIRRAGQSLHEDVQYGVQLNPSGTDVLTFAEGDQLIVLANN